MIHFSINKNLLLQSLNITNVLLVQKCYIPLFYQLSKSMLQMKELALIGSNVNFNRELYFSKDEMQSLINFP